MATPTPAQAQQIRTQLAALYSIDFLVYDIADVAEQEDSASLTRVAALLAAMRSYLFDGDPAIIANVVAFADRVVGAHERCGTRRRPRTAAPITSLASMLASPSICITPDGVSCTALERLESTQGEKGVRG